MTCEKDGCDRRAHKLVRFETGAPVGVCFGCLADLRDRPATLEAETGIPNRRRRLSGNW